ncbi:hypothetical protein KIL84_004240, partial [Mauremys mutica]
MSLQIQRFLCISTRTGMLAQSWASFVTEQVIMKRTIFSFFHGFTVSSFLPGYVVFFIALHIHSFASGKFTVTGPDHPITTSIGGEAILPCHLSPRMSAENMEVRWFRFQYHSVVHLYQEGQDKYEEQMLEYHGRTELLKDGITNGSVSLRIHQVKLSDHGQYTCFFQYNIFYEEAILELMVSELFFPRVNPWIVALGVILAILIALASYCFWRQHGMKEMLRSDLARQKEEHREEIGKLFTELGL